MTQIDGRKFACINAAKGDDGHKELVNFVAAKLVGVNYSKADIGALPGVGDVE